MKKLISITLCLIFMLSFPTQSFADGIEWRHVVDYARDSGDWLKSDWVGRDILLGYLGGGGATFDSYKISKESSNTYWGPYMMKSKLLKRKVGDLLEEKFNDISKNKSETINISTSMVIENGESIIGHQYLHGTNSNVGGFKIKGTASKDDEGNVTADLFFQWNDKIDPNFSYETDRIKAEVAKRLPGANPSDYIIRIGWDHKVIKNIKEPEWYEPWKPKSTWPFN
ncbi:MAG: hypothetical protein MJA82_00160 [Clostridia bacterium]|nr:hypothetical protein [Clostridia bacterium]